MSRPLANWLLLGATAVVMAGAFELACRIIAADGLHYDVEMWKYAVQAKRIAADPALGHEHVPGARAHLMGVDVEINGAGLRDREIALAKPPGTTRILMLGDSITFGWGVKQDETASVVLERMLKRSGHDVQVINSGVGNYNTAMEVEYFRKRGVAYEPDIVVLNYFINDAEPTPVYSPPSWIERHSYGYVFLSGGWDRIRRLVFGAPEWRAYYNDLYADDAGGWRAAQSNIENLAAYCREHGIRLVLANVPELHELRDYPFVGVNRKIAAIAAAAGVEYLDLLPALQAEDPSTLWVTAPDPHPNAKAQALMASALAAYLLSTWN